MADSDAKGDGEGVLAQATSEEVQRGTKRPAEAAELDQEDDLKPAPTKLRESDDSESDVDSKFSNTSDSPDSGAISEESGPRCGGGMDLTAYIIMSSESSEEPETSSSQIPNLQYCLVSEEAGIQPALAKLRERSDEYPFLAVDCEGEELSRRGKLSIVSVATHSHTYLFDIATLGAKVFDEGLKELLEDPGREKLMFDCRADSDCLWHLYNVRLANVVDLQLLQFIESKQSITTRSHVNGYRKCLAVYVRDTNLTKIKDEGAALMGEGGTEWMKRPLPEILLKYAAVDVQGFFILYDKLKKALDDARARTSLQLGSQRYLNLFRDKVNRSYDKYELNSYLPRRVLDDRHYQQQRTCLGCRGAFPKRDFNGDKCPVCMRILNSL